MSFLNAEEPTAVDPVTGFGNDVIRHPSLGMELGEDVQQIMRECASGERQVDVFVSEGAVLLGPDGSAIDLTNERYANTPSYAEAVRRFAPFVGTAYEKGVTLSNMPVEVSAILGGQWPHSSFMVPGGVMSAPTPTDVTGSIAILEYWKNEWLEKEWLGCSLERWMQTRTWQDLLAWVDENDAQRNSDCGFFIRYALEVRLDRYGAGPGSYLSTGTFLDPELYQHPTVQGRNAALISRSGIYAGGGFHEFDQARVREDHTRSFYRGTGALHPFEGVTDPIDPKDGDPKDGDPKDGDPKDGDPKDGEAQGKYSWAKSPRYDVPGLGHVPLEVGPLARQVMAAQPGPAAHQDADPLFLNVINEVGSSILVRVLARTHELAKYCTWARRWLDELDLHEPLYAKPTEHGSGQGLGSTEAARGALSDWIVLDRGRIENYQVITPRAWNVGPRDAAGVVGPIEQTFIGTPVENTADPVELDHVARSFDSCLVCTVHAYDGRSGKELTRFMVGGM